MKYLLLLLLIAMSTATSSSTGRRPRALVYRGPSVCEGCPEAVAQLLRSSPSRFEVRFAGPKESVQVNEESLDNVELFAVPGGPDLDEIWKEIKSSKDAIRNFVSNGGRYLGFCLGAYLAGRQPGLGLLPKGSDTDSESDLKGAQVENDKDTVIQVDWTFTAGDEAGKTVRRWVFFQEGAVIQGLKESNTAFVLGRYSTSGRVAASLTKFGQGWVGLTGPHPEASPDWFEDEGIEYPDGLQYDIGYDLIEAVMRGRGPEVQRS